MFFHLKSIWEKMKEVTNKRIIDVLLANSIFYGVIGHMGGEIKTF